MKVAISGATGFVGKYLTQYLEIHNCTVIPLTRKLLSSSETSIHLIQALEDTDVVINLAGASIGRRWSKSYKKELMSSRVDTTRMIVCAINQLVRKPKLLISASAVGYYASDEVYDESNGVKADSFLSDLCEMWEYEANQVSSEVRLAITRFGVILDKKGGAFNKLALSAKLGVATVYGSGKQSFSWISLKDVARAFWFIIQNEELQGIINLTSNELITNQELIDKLKKHYHSWLKVKIPAFFFQIALGEASQFVLDGQAAFPRKLFNAGFVFEQPTIDSFLKES